MLGYLVRRLVGALLVLVLIGGVTYALLDLAPGDAAMAQAGETASQAQLDQVRQELGLGGPWWVRYGRYAAQAVLHGDLGTSWAYGRPVASLLGERFTRTAELALAGMVLALLVGLGVGTLAARHRGGSLDFTLMALTGLGISLPAYWVAMLLILVFSLRLGWFPVVSTGSLSGLVLPAVCLALPSGAVFARLVRSSLLDAERQDYVRTAYAKGLKAPLVWRKHILRNSLIPVITMAGLQLGHLLGGAFVIETFFSWPGLGRLIVQSIFERDYPVIVGAVLLLGVIYQGLNLVVDMAHAWLDPRLGREAL